MLGFSIDCLFCVAGDMHKSALEFLLVMNGLGLYDCKVADALFELNLIVLIRILHPPPLSPPFCFPTEYIVIIVATHYYINDRCVVIDIIFDLDIVVNGLVDRGDKMLQYCKICLSKESFRESCFYNFYLRSHNLPNHHVLFKQPMDISSNNVRRHNLSYHQIQSTLLV